MNQDDFAEFPSETGIDPFILLEMPLAVSGYIAAEAFAGKHSVTLGRQFARAPCITPFEIEDDWRLCILAHGQSLLELLCSNKLHLAIIEQPCQTLSLARWPQLRDWSSVYGKDHVGGINQAALMPIGNALVRFTISFMMTLFANGRYFICENPKSSWLWVIFQLFGIDTLPGLAYHTINFGAFGAVRNTETTFLHNLPCLKLKPPFNHNLPPLILRGTMVWYGMTSSLHGWRRRIPQLGVS